MLGILWLVSRAAPSATRDPVMTPPEIVPTPTPTPEATPAATPASRRPGDRDSNDGSDRRTPETAWSRPHPERRKRGSTTGSSASARSMKASAVMTIRMPGGSTHHQ